MISLPKEDENYTPTKIETGDNVAFKMQTNKADLNQLINHYLKKEGLTGGIDYQVILNEDVELLGSIPIFSQNIQLKLSFEPTALDNGDIVLEQKSISVGKLQLPVSYVLHFIKENYKLPKWVIIQPNEEKIYVSLKDMKLKSNIKVKVDDINLAADDIHFTLLVPAK